MHSIPQHHNQPAAASLRGAVNATFRAIASPQAANVGPVGMSELARRRAKDKVTHTHLWEEGMASPVARKKATQWMAATEEVEEEDRDD